MIESVGPTISIMNLCANKGGGSMTELTSYAAPVCKPLQSDGIRMANNSPCLTGG